MTVKLDNVSIEMIHRKTEHSLAKYDSFTGSNLQAVENEITIEKIQY